MIAVVLALLILPLAAGLISAALLSSRTLPAKLASAVTVVSGAACFALVLALIPAVAHKDLSYLSYLRIDAVYLPAEKDALVGGDWYDAFELPDGRLVFSIGDVAGHGLEASITVGRLRQAIFTLAWRENDPGAILKELDQKA